MDKFAARRRGAVSPPRLPSLRIPASSFQDEVLGRWQCTQCPELDKYSIGFCILLSAPAGVYSAIERFQISLDSLSQLAARGIFRPGRKIILWFLPGWPLLSGAGVEEQMDTKQQQQIFNQVVARLRQSRITLYSIDPLGSATFSAVPSDGGLLSKESANPARPNMAT